MFVVEIYDLMMRSKHLIISGRIGFVISYALWILSLLYSKPYCMIISFVLCALSIAVIALTSIKEIKKTFTQLE